MRPRTAAELLYESEASLRLVDHVLDDFQVSDTNPAGPSRSPYTALSTLTAERPPRSPVPSEFCIRTYWQIQEALDFIQQSREEIQTLVKESQGRTPQERGNNRLKTITDQLTEAEAKLIRLGHLFDGAEPRD